jgi:hypothetical protein
MNELREEIEQSETRKKVQAAHAAIRALCNGERFLMSIPANRRTDHDLILSDALLALDADLEIAEAANREKDAEIARLKGIIAADDERLLVASVRVGFPFYGCDTADWLAEEILSLRASVGEKDVEIARLNKSEDELLTERDKYYDLAERLSEAISELTGVDLGEHSNLNDPFQNALEAESSLRASVNGEKEFMQQNAKDISAILKDAIYPGQKLDNIYALIRHAMIYVNLQLDRVAPPSTEKES